MLSGVVGAAAKHSGSNTVLVAFDKALVDGKLPATGKVTERVVRSAYASLERSSTKFSIDNIPNPLPPPHNLSWYFSCCTCPPEVRQFATMLGHGNIRVWSVARDLHGWFILAQVFGAESPEEAVGIVELQTRLPVHRLRNHVLDTISPFSMEPQNIENFMHEHAKNILKRKGLGTFVEIFLERRS